MLHKHIQRKNIIATHNQEQRSALIVDQQWPSDNEPEETRPVVLKMWKHENALPNFTERVQA